LFPKQFRIHAVLLLAALFMIFFPMLREKPDSEKAEKATAAAMVFLQLIDAEQYAESWRSAAGLMKEKVTQEDWIEKLTKARVISGALVERLEESASYSTYAQDSPDGEYVSLTFESKFQRAEKVSEYVTVMLEGEHWKVAGYFMK
jgi:membrane-bound lytic murein transglycosylase